MSEGPNTRRRFAFSSKAFLGFAVVVVLAMAVLANELYKGWRTNQDIQQMESTSTRIAR